MTENRLVSTVISDDDVREAIMESGRGWVVDREGEVVAFAIGNAKSGNIWALFVDPGHQRRGYGRRLHETVVSWMWSQGLERLWLTTEAGTRAQTFYEAAGWQLIGPVGGGELRYELLLPESMDMSADDGKWRALRQAVYTDLPFSPPYQLKTVRESAPFPERFDADVDYWGDWSEGCLPPVHEVEWIRVRPRYLRHRGRLVAPEVVDIEQEFLQLLTKLDIPYARDGDTIRLLGSG